MHRFFVAPELVRQLHADIPLPAELAHQLRDVLHLQVGEQIVLLDNSGDEILATIASVSKSAVGVQPLERRAGRSESPVRIILCQGLLKAARFEWILEKGTELGVSIFSPILCRRSMAGLEDAGTSKIQRWQRIIQEAAEQSGRTRLPELLPIRSLKDALKDILPGALALMPWEEERDVTLRDALRDGIYRVGSSVDEGDRKGPPSTFPHPRPYYDYEGDPSVHSRGGGGVDEGRGPLRSPSNQLLPARHNQITIVLFIGPEGGLTIEEVKLAQRHGAQVVSLGSRILRAETAALAAVASVMYELEGEL
jgi:16S rRNA (uracil1498-N3)-methyltransferase